MPILPLSPLSASLRRKVVAGILLAALAVTATACGKADRDTIVVGTKFDEPGIALRGPDGTMSGFDVDVARYIVRQLGYRDDQIEWTEAHSARRESLIGQEPGGRLGCGQFECTDKVTFIAATYTITEGRKRKVDFAGPYLLTGQSLLVRVDNTDITGPESLRDDRRVCSITGSTSAQRITDDYPGAQLQQLDTTSECVAALRAGKADAVSTDEAILAGFAAQSPGDFKLVGKPFSEELYGIGLRLGDDELRAKINDALAKMEAEGAWAAAFEKNLGASGLSTPAPPALDRY